MVPPSFTLTSMADLERLKQHRRSRETFVTVRVTHDARFDTPEGRAQLANLIAQRAYTIEGVSDAQATSQAPFA